MSYREIECFVATARAGSFSAAAESLNLSQPALWAHIHKLEERLKAPLFKRHARGVSPTAAGINLLPLAIEIVDAMARFEDAGKRLHGRKARRILLGVTPTPSQLLLPGLMAYCKKHGRTVGVTLARSAQLLEMVATGTLDAAICYDPAGDERVAAFPLYSEVNFLIGPPALVDSSRGPIRFDDLVKLPLVMDTGSMAARVARRRRVDLDILDEIDVFNVRRDMLLHHGRCSIMSYALVEEEIREGKLAARKIVEPELVPTASFIAAEEPESDLPTFLLAGIRPLVQQNIAAGRPGWRPPRRRRVKAVL